MSSRKTLTFILAMSLSAVGLTATAAHAAYIHAVASTCQPLNNASLVLGGAPTTGGGANNGPGLYQGSISTGGNGTDIRVVCPVVDTSSLVLTDTSLFNNVAPVVFLPVTSQAKGQVCTEFIAAVGGSCGAAVGSAVTSGKTNWAVPTTNWQSNPSDYHWLFVSIPTSAANGQFYGYSVF